MFAHRKSSSSNQGWLDNHPKKKILLFRFLYYYKRSKKLPYMYQSYLKLVKYMDRANGDDFISPSTKTRTILCCNSFLISFTSFPSREKRMYLLPSRHPRIFLIKQKAKKKQFQMRQKKVTPSFAKTCLINLPQLLTQLPGANWELEVKHWQQSSDHQQLQFRFQLHISQELFFEDSFLQPPKSEKKKQRDHSYKIFSKVVPHRNLQTNTNLLGSSVLRSSLFLFSRLLPLTTTISYFSSFIAHRISIRVNYILRFMGEQRRLNQFPTNIPPWSLIHCNHRRNWRKSELRQNLGFMCEFGDLGKIKL